MIRNSYFTSTNDTIEPARAVESFSFRIDNAKILCDILASLCLNTRHDHPCLIEASSDSITFIVTGKAKSRQARLTIPAGLFDDFVYVSTSDVIQLSLNLTTFLDCLSMFGFITDEISAVITYSVEDAILKLSLEETGVLTVCEISTIFQDLNDDLENSLFTGYLSNAEDSQVILKSAQLRELINEVCEMYGASTVSIEIIRSPAQLKLSSNGVLGICEIAIPRNSDAIVSFRCEHDLVWTYPIASVQLGMKALSIAKETFIRVNDKGITCIQHQIETDKGHDIFVDFLMVAEESCSDNAEEDDNNSNSNDADV